MPWTVKPEQLAKIVARDTSKLMRESALEVFGEIIAISPVDIGTFRGNWNVGIGAPDRTVFEDVIDTTGISLESYQKQTSQLSTIDATGNHTFDCTTIGASVGHRLDCQPLAGLSTIGWTVNRRRDCHP